MEDPPLRFFCDEQLGKLARWLRIIGQDTLYQREIDDAELLDRARAEKRIVLTRDRNLAALAPDVEVVCLEENYPALQLREVVERFEGRIEVMVFVRCAVCNRLVEPVARAEVENLVPPFVFSTQEQFTRCPGCGRVYWKATHRDRVELQLRDILGPLYHSP